MTLAASSRSIAIELAATATGTRELRRLPFRRLSFGTRKRCANQPTMHGSFVFSRALVYFIFVFVLVFGSGWNFLGMMHNGFFRKRRLLYRDGLGERLARWGFLRSGRDQRLFLAARRRNASLLVFVIRVARGAARLLHLIVNHRHNRVIGDAAFTRTIVVQNVTEPKPALLH
jgi:hypothetical protein